MSTKTINVSPFSRACLVAYLVLIVYASWYPFSGWEFENFAAFFDQIKQWPRYWTKFDAIVNVVGYMPLGLFIVFSTHPKFSRKWSLIIATLAGLAMTVFMESIQFFLPSRVTSPLDILTNFAGCLMGAIIGVLLLPMILENGKLQNLGNRWLRHDTPREMLALGLWPLAQVFPQAFLFGLGHILPVISLWCEEYLDITIDLGSILRNGIELSAEEYLLSEAIITACAGTGAILICLSLLQRHAPKLMLAFLLLLAGLCIKALSTALLFQPEDAFTWLTPGAKGGLVISMIMLYGFSFAPIQAQRRLAILLLTLSIVLVNIIPSNPYFAMTLQTMAQGKMLNFYGAAQFLALIWPFLAIWFLTNPSRKDVPS
jgi:VanZ family protein